MSEADEVLLDRLRDEVAAAIGPRVVVLAITPAVDPSGIRLIAECRTPIGPWRVEGVGGNVVDAAVQLIARASEDRLTVAFREVVAT